MGCAGSVTARNFDTVSLSGASSSESIHVSSEEPVEFHSSASGSRLGNPMNPKFMAQPHMKRMNSLVTLTYSNVSEISVTLKATAGPGSRIFFFNTEPVHCAVAMPDSFEAVALSLALCEGLVVLSLVLSLVCFKVVVPKPHDHEADVHEALLEQDFSSFIDLTKRKDEKPDCGAGSLSRGCAAAFVGTIASTAAVCAVAAAAIRAGAAAAPAATNVGLLFISGCFAATITGTIAAAIAAACQRHLSCPCCGRRHLIVVLGDISASMRAMNRMQCLRTSFHELIVKAAEAKRPIILGAWNAWVEFCPDEPSERANWIEALSSTGE